TGEVRGEAPSVMRYVAAALEIDSLQWFPLQFDNLMPALERGRIDVIASGLFITEARGRLVRFSLPTACLHSSLVVRRATALERPFECDACTVAVIRGSVEEHALHAARTNAAEGTTFVEDGHEVRHPAIGDAAGPRLLAAPDASTAVAAVKSGDALALAISAPTARLIASRDTALAVRDTVPPALMADPGCAALAFRPTDRSLAAAFDAVLAGFVGSDTHQALVAEFGFTRAEVCAAAARADDSTAGTCR
ncbi:MAG TPA: transporter substrate-binding domain-containing protein, partial [Longimicrobiales bacterium]|nr:transporter substrate-binding domain-containing protein [Longimicrobiales bacterium]